MGNYMKIICLKEKYLAKKLYICTRKRAKLLTLGKMSKLFCPRLTAADETKKLQQWILQKCSPETKPSASSDDTSK